MCGRFAQSQPLIHYAHALDPAWTPMPLDLLPTWNMAPSRQVLVFHDAEAGHVAELFKWGFLPAWADPAATQKPINARVESAATRPYFRKAWKTGRCIIPADGWFEWKAGERGKQPYFIHRADDQPVLMAGLYETNPHADVTTFAILTMEAKGALREVHDREPIVLSAEMGREWIKPDLKPDEVNAVIRSPMAAESFTWHAVSTKVNSTRHDGKELILRAE